MRLLHSTWLMLLMMPALHAMAPSESATAIEPIQQLEEWASLISQPNRDYINENTTSITRNRSVLKWKQLRSMLETYCRMPFFLEGAEARVSGIKNVNPQIIDCIDNTLKSFADNVVFNDLFEVVYSRYLRIPVRGYHSQSDYWLMDNSTYLGREVITGSKLDAFVSGLRETNSIVGSFWQRRKADGSAAKLQSLLTTLVTRYDPYYHRIYTDYHVMDAVRKLEEHGCHPLVSSQRKLYSCPVVDFYKVRPFIDDCEIRHAKIKDGEEGADIRAYQCREFIREVRGLHDLEQVIGGLVQDARDKDYKRYLDAIVLLEEIAGWPELYRTVTHMKSTDGMTLFLDAMKLPVLNEAFLESVYQNKYLYDQLRANIVQQGASTYGASRHSLLDLQQAYKMIMALDLLRLKQGVSAVEALNSDCERSNVLSADQKNALQAKVAERLRFVVSSTAWVRAQPGATADQQDKLPIRTGVLVTHAEGKWSHVSYTDAPSGQQKQGWVYTTLLGNKRLSADELMVNYRNAVTAEEKRNWIERAAATQPRNHEVLKELATFYEEIGDTDAAKSVRRNLEK